MPRDNFPRDVIERLAKRAGMKCSCPDCRLPTTGPGVGDGVTNTGVAAHIAAASPGGARYDEMMTQEERSSIINGIWLCQTHAKMIDDDELTYTVAVLKGWKSVTEQMAALEARGYEVRRAKPFHDLEKKAPDLVAEMRQDLLKSPLVRQFIILPKGVSYNPGKTPFFVYYDDDHPDILAVTTIMIHYGAIYDIAFNDVPRYNFCEDFVEYLIGP